MLRWFRRLHSAGDPAAVIDDGDWARACADAAVLAALGDDARARLRELAQGLLRSKDITAVAGLELERHQRTLIAALACVPVLHLGLDWLRGWHQLVIYPGQFGVRRHHHDEATGVVSEWDDELAGEAWDRGPVILSWADIREDLGDPEAGFSVVAHEIAHKLDALDGVMDGTPPLRRGMRQADWVAAFQPAYEAICAEVDAGREPPIDPYAAESPDEFFAVASEYHFSAPALLAAAMPAVAAQLAAFYGPSPMLPQRLTGTARSAR